VLWLTIQQELSLSDAGIELTMRLHVLKQTVLCIPYTCIFLAIFHYDLALAGEVVMEMR
jgi:hypothetical protein